ncbi:hypothetical protein N7539_005462 [Penicillium diatomitis]|uniref:Cupin type-2 domain-containing protein n=1 Tax=Penicillium diatomitis TaxID=2819901 RepID=A0A9X0BUS0_9EURO|nr:uncharacterized protein N7539_005462 [Penicillium diatomitis]KAJ5485474.1 hypothetical protein N7539_005462 [Penicillium diatomitis]
MLSFLARHVPRNKTAHLNPIHFDAGRSSIEFKPPTDQYLVINRWPPASSTANKAIALRPPLHWHRHQTETFHVLAGAAEFIYDGRTVVKRADQTMPIPAGVVHTFCNASTTEELAVDFVLEPSICDSQAV